MAAHLLCLRVGVSRLRWKLTNTIEMAGFSTIGGSLQREPGLSLRLMPLGGSVTYGSESSDKNGYRKALLDLLVVDGHSVEMVGSRRAGTMDNNANEGWRGFRIDQIQSRAERSIAASLPNLVTVNAGSNDCIQDHDMDRIGQRMARMLQFIWDTSPQATIILSTLLFTLAADAESRVLLANEQLRELATQEAARGQRIILVDMHGLDGPQAGDLADGTHPNDVGYAKVANIWHRGIREAISKEFVQPPHEKL